jgi:hypothetical protein
MLVGSAVQQGGWRVFFQPAVTAAPRIAGSACGTSTRHERGVSILRGMSIRHEHPSGSPVE